MSLFKYPTSFVQVHGGYARRTEVNAMADITLAFAFDFKTAGERLTKRAVQDAGREYLPVQYYPGDAIASSDVDRCVAAINYAGRKQSSRQDGVFIVNVAGNGIYTLAYATTAVVNQAHVDAWMRDAMEKILLDPNLVTTVDLIWSGGQTGFDEAGIKAARELGFRTEVRAPSGWLYRNVEGRDVRDEYHFKARFK